ncbi:hypothetical protein FLAV_02112 [Flavobacteriales bacterium]|nr:DUF4835 family protein [Flavobacteriales bacterium]WKZ76058.1 MAG: DUF4835 family protein [Vicingaceae bacterium]GIK70495.1 MAG: DUF4835 domain-containing protein [Bacteroidota bacterium]CAG0987371.1 hypothetical protein FLAV_02112 [Flavobacteriales bacterium]
MRKKLTYFLLLICVNSLYAQELNCVVQVNSTQVANVEKRVFETLQKAIFEFMNNRKWTTDIYKNDERIQCNILLNITEVVSQNEFKATISVQSSRSVYASSYSSTIINHIDKDFQFKYVEYEPLEFSDNVFISNLTAVLGYYAYIILGADYDTFSQNGGTPYFQKALAIVNLAQSAPEQGWKAFENINNRYWIAENYTNQIFSPLREFMYKYHRLAFDIMATDVDKGRKEAFEALKLLEKVHIQRPGNFQLSFLFNAKADEIINLFQGSTDANEKQEVLQLLGKINPQNINRYQKILQNN